MMSLEILVYKTYKKDNQNEFKLPIMIHSNVCLVRDRKHTQVLRSIKVAYMLM